MVSWITGPTDRVIIFPHQNMAKASNTSSGPKFVRFFWPLIRSLQKLGGSGTASEVIEAIVNDEKIPEKTQQERLKSGGLRLNNQIYFARQYLLWAGYVSSSSRGIWTLTESGQNLKELKHEDAVKLMYSIHKQKSAKADSPVTADVIENGLEASENEGTSSNIVPEVAHDYRHEALTRLRTLSPKGFEHFCKRLLRESGFERVEVTGGPKDKGIDGEGLLKLNSFMSFRVVFQCKRYADSVTSNHISTFRGSIPSSADKGILITTGYFTSDAIKMAQEKGLKPIELINGDQLVKLMEELQLGLKQTYVVDKVFFDEFTEG